MPSKRIERHIKRLIQDRGGWDVLEERIASGETIQAISREFLRPDGLPISRRFLSMLLHQDPARSARILAARPDAADALVDRGIEAVRTAPLDRDAIQKAKAEADVSLRVAGLLDRERWGEKKQDVQVSVNLATLHIDALRHQPVVLDSLQEVSLQEVALSAVRKSGARVREANRVEATHDVASTHQMQDVSE